MLIFYFVLSFAVLVNARFFKDRQSGREGNTAFWKKWGQTNHTAASTKFDFNNEWKKHNNSNGYETDEYCVYDLRMSYIYGCPDGVQKRIIGFNGQFPGPTLTCTEGKTMVVRVTNDVSGDEPTSIHWHGIQQNLSPFYDGPQSVTQCPVIKRTSMIYKFQVFQSGTYWYHSHHSYQYVDGAWGFLIVKNVPAECWQNSYDDERLISVNDWIHRPAKNVSATYLADGNLPDTNSSLINGRGTFSCSKVEKGQKCSTRVQGPAVIDVTRGKRYRLRILNSSGLRPYNFSIDGHKMVVIETDGVDTFKSPEVDVIELHPAQRYSVLVTMNKPLNEYWIRISGEPIGSSGLIGKAVLRYNNDNRRGPRDAFGFASAQSTQWNQQESLVSNSQWSPAQSQRSSAQGSSKHHHNSERPAQNSNGNSYEPPAQSSQGSQQQPDSAIAQGVQGSQTQSGTAGLDQPMSGAFQGRPDYQDIQWDDIIASGGIIPDDELILEKFFPKDPPTINSKLQGQLDEDHAKLVKETKLPTSSPVNPTTAVLLDQQQCPPLQFGIEGSAPPNYDQLVTINVTKCPINGQPARMCMNGQPYVPGNLYSRPILYDVISGRKIPSSTRPIYTPKHQKVIRIVINNFHPNPHPWHLHGHSFWVLGTGDDQAGPYAPSRDGSKLTTQGVRRDTTHTLGNSWSVITYTTDNPGAWFFHCHINWHLEAGLGMTFIENEEVAKQVYQFPPASAEDTCEKLGVSLY